MPKVFAASWNPPQPIRPLGHSGFFHYFLLLALKVAQSLGLSLALDRGDFPSPGTPGQVRSLTGRGSGVAIVEVGKFPGFTRGPLKRAAEWGNPPFTPAGCKAVGYKTRLARRDFWRPPALRFLPSQWTKRALGFLATPTLQDQTCLQTGGDLDRAEAAVPYYGEILFGLFLSSIQAAG